MKIVKSALLGRIVLWLIVLGIATIGPWMLSRALARLHRLSTSGVTVTATVDRAWQTTSKGTTTYHLEVEFTKDGVSVDQEKRVSASVYGGYQNQPTVPVTTMPGDPNNFEVGPITEEMTSDTEAAYETGLGVFGAVFVAILVFFEVQLGVEKRFLKYGEATTAEVTSSKYIVAGRTATTKIQFTVDTPAGSFDGAASISGNKVEAYPPGHKAVLVYMPNNVQKQKLLESFTMVQVAP